ncbi:unnamed protein product [Chrysoparadoxa australica]
MAWREFSSKASQQGDLNVQVWLQDSRAQAAKALKRKAELKPVIAQCDVVTPGSEHRAEEIADMLGTWFYYEVSGPLMAITSMACCRDEHFVACSVSTDANAISISGGRLICHLDEETFQTLGLPAKAIKLGHNRGMVLYRSEVDLAAASFRPGKPLYDKLVAVLSGHEVVMMVCWTDQQGKNKAVDFPEGVTAKRKPVCCSTRVMHDVCIPEVCMKQYSAGAAGAGAGAAGGGDAVSHQPEAKGIECALFADMFEWLGAVACGLEGVLKRESDPFLGAFQCPSHMSYRQGQLVRVRLKGLLPSGIALVVAAALKDSSQKDWHAITAWRRRHVPAMQATEFKAEAGEDITSAVLGPGDQAAVVIARCQSLAP